jgi:hypothetical protein
MIVNKFKLPNKNTFIWLGNQPIFGCENVLILSGGNVHFLKPVQTYKIIEIQGDIEQLSRRDFFIKYQWPDNSSGNDLYDELSKTNEYPGFLNE